MIDGINAAHRFLASLFFDDMRDDSGCPRDHDMPLNAVGGISKSARMAPIAPSTLIGSDFFASANAFSTARAVCMCQAVNLRVSLGSSRLNDFS